MENENLFISIDFDKGIFPKKNTCDGEDISPQIHIDRIHSAYLAVIIDDWIGPSERFTHWLMWNIEPRALIPENILRPRRLPSHSRPSREQTISARSVPGPLSASR